MGIREMISLGWFLCIENLEHVLFFISGLNLGQAQKLEQFLFELSTIDTRSYTKTRPEPNTMT